MKNARSRTCVAAAILAIFASPATHALQKLGNFTLPGYGPFPFVCCPIAMGSLLAMGTRRVRILIVSSKLLSDARSLLLALTLIPLLDVVPNQSGAPGDFLQILQNSMLTFCVARLVFIPTGLAGRALNSAPFVQIGKLSYSLYLWQQLFLYKMAGKGVFLLILAFILILAVASASYWGLEARFLGLRKKLRNASVSKMPLSSLDAPL
jgi:peptidoglycan/LPS O-acetylase OafA/YrhL